MATIIDSLIVTLGLDPSAFSQGSKQVGKGLKDTREDADRTAKELEAKGKVAAQFFGKIRDQAIALGAVLLAGKGAKSFISDITSTDAAVGRTAKNIGVATETLSRWQHVAELTGGSATGITGSMQGLSQQFQQLALTGQSQVVPYFRAVGVALADSTGKMRPMNDILLDLSDKLSKMDPSRAQALGRGLGLDEGTVNMLMRGRVALEKYMATVKYTTDADSDAAQQRDAAFKKTMQGAEDLGRKLLTTIEPALESVLKGLIAVADWFAAHPNVFAVFAGTLAATAALMTAALTVLSFRGFFGLIGVMLKVPAAAARAAAAMLTAATASGASLTAMLGGLAVSAGLLAAAGAVGFAIGTAIYSAIEETKVADKLGEWITRTLAFFGNEEAKQTLAIQKRVAEAQRLSKGAVGPTAAPAAPARVAAGAAPAPLASNAGPPNAARKEQAQRDIDKLIGMGWTREQAAGIAANIQAESAGNERAVGDNGTAYGLAQWHPDRQKAFEAWAGKNIRQASRDEQLAFINHELRQGGEQRAGRSLMQATDAGQAAAIVSRQYERPKFQDADAAKRAGIATSLLAPGPRVDRSMVAGAQAAVASNTTNNTTSHSSSSETHIGQVNVTLPNATDAESVAKGLAPAMQKNMSFAAQANYTLA